MRDALGNPWLVRIGMRAYAIYLFHPGVIQFADALVAPGQDALAPQGVRLLMIMGGSVLVAEVLCRFVEAPCIRLGRRLAAEGPRTQPTDKGGDPEPPLGVQSVPAPRKPLTGQRSGVSRIWQRGRDLNPR